MRLLATCTKRLSRWKKSARLKNFPPKVKVSGPVSSPGTPLVAPAAVALAEPPPTGSPPDLEAVEVAVCPGLSPLCCTAWALPVAAALLADSVALPKLLAAGVPPAATGGCELPEEEVLLALVPVLGVVGVTVEAGTRAPTLMSPKTMPVPLAAAWSCTSKLGMSTCVGMALPRRTISEYWVEKWALAWLRAASCVVAASRVCWAAVTFAVRSPASLRLGERRRNQ